MLLFTVPGADGTFWVCVGAGKAFTRKRQHRAPVASWLQQLNASKSSMPAC